MNDVRQIYLDNSATTKICDEALEKYNISFKKGDSSNGELIENVAEVVATLNGAFGADVPRNNYKQ